MNVTDYIKEEYGTDARVYGSDVTASAIMQYEEYKDFDISEVKGLWHEGPMGVQEIKEKINEIDKGSYVIIRSGASDADKLITSGKLTQIGEFGVYKLYGR
jgi:hypothetical protein